MSVLCSDLRPLILVAVRAESRRRRERRVFAQRDTARSVLEEGPVKTTRAHTVLLRPSFSHTHRLHVSLNVKDMTGYQRIW